MKLNFTEKETPQEMTTLPQKYSIITPGSTSTLTAFISTCITLLFLFSGCATTQTSNQPTTPYEITLKDTSFSVLDGDIYIGDVSITIDDAVVNDEISPSPNNINATVTNNTDASLESITFDISLKTETGRTVATDPVSVTHRTRSGSVAELDYPLAESMYGKVKYNDGMSFELDFRDATYNSNYGFTLTDRNGMSFENDSLRIDFNPTKEGIGFKMKNKMDESIQILWDRVSYVDIEGSSHSVIKSGTQYSERNESIKPTSVAPNSFVDEVIFPSDYIEYNSYANEYTKEKLFPNGQRSERYEGKEFSVYMPISFGGDEESINFTFKITNVSY